MLDQPYFDVQVPYYTKNNGDNYEFVNFLEEIVPPYPGDESVFDSPFPSPQYPKPEEYHPVHQQTQPPLSMIRSNSTSFHNSKESVSKIKPEPVVVRPSPVVVEDPYISAAAAAAAAMNTTTTPIGYRTRAHPMIPDENCKTMNLKQSQQHQSKSSFTTEKMNICYGPDLIHHNNNHQLHHHHLHNQNNQNHHQTTNNNNQNHHPNNCEQNGSKPNRKRKAISPTFLANKIKTEQDSISLSREELLSFSSEQFEDFVMQITAVRDLSQSEKNEIKRQRRLIKNRESAQASRQRKKSHIDELERKVKDLGNENIHLKEKISSVDHENSYLKKELSQLQAFVNKMNRH